MNRGARTEELVVGARSGGGIVLRVVVVCLLLVLAGCKARDGDILRQVAQRAASKLQDASGPAAQLPAGVPVPVPRVSLVARVEARIRYDRHLADHSLVVRAQGTNAVVVTGTVPEPSIKQRALDLAKSTVGVERVVDEVQLAEEE
jgi:hypothetical protein